jgi:hypothetical protein
MSSMPEAPKKLAHSPSTVKYCSKLLKTILKAPAGTLIVFVPSPFQEPEKVWPPTVKE